MAQFKKMNVQHRTSNAPTLPTIGQATEVIPFVRNDRECRFEMKEGHPLNPMNHLPIDDVIPELRAALSRWAHAVLQAPPGAGKTTRVPLALLEEPWLEGRRIVMLEPRRLAVRAAARRMALTLGQDVGMTVGYRIRMDTRVSARTRIEVVTEGILTRVIQHDPSLEGIGAVIFDEFHERSLHADLGLALCLEARDALRPDLRIIVMSATLEGGPVAELLGGAPVITGKGRRYPVETVYAERDPEGRVEDAVNAAVRAALAREHGSILAFLPGAGEIRRTEELLRTPGPGVIVAPLFGALPQDAQDRAVLPAPEGMRKVVLATSIAETSLTIEGIRIVVDGGRMRVPRFDPCTAMTRLVTVRVTKDAADQRRGRAGRLEPGLCYRLWTRYSQSLLVPRRLPELLAADLASTALDLACWGVSDPSELSWLDPPPAPAFAQARDLLVRLGALDGRGRVTAHGRKLADIALHPRLAHMIIEADAMGLGGLGCEVAALLNERDIMREQAGFEDRDVRTRVEELRRFEHGRSSGLPAAVDPAAVRRVARSARHLRRGLSMAPSGSGTDRVGELLARAFPDRIARARPERTGRFLLSNGRGAAIAETDPLAREDYLVAAHLDGGVREARVFLAAPVSRDALETLFASRISVEARVSWDGDSRSVVARRRTLLDSLVLRDELLATPPGELVVSTLIRGIRREGLDILPWNRETRQLRARILFLRRVSGVESWPDCSDHWLLKHLEIWLAPYLPVKAVRNPLLKIDLRNALLGMLEGAQRRNLDRLAPTHLAVPSGSRITLDYTAGDTPVLAVRLQELFGLPESPTVADGRVRVLVHLLSPAMRPVQVTRDLAGFWAGGYHDVKKDLKGRYPKHSWPDDPLTAEPVRGAARRKSLR